jgi:predicted O-methyltransferase YrrM
VSEAERALGANQGRRQFPDPDGILTAVNPSEARKLQDLAAGQRVLELGALHGYSTLAMAATGAEVWSVDWHRGDEQSQFGDTLASWAEHTRAQRFRGSVVGLIGRFEQVLPLLRRESFGGCFHDGAHDAESVARDIRLALPLLRPGGWLAVHDWGVYGVSAGLRPLLGDPDLRVNSLAIWERPLIRG